MPARTAALLSALVLAFGAAASRAQGGPPGPPGPLQPPPVPPENPITPAKANLGKALFFDEQLGSNRSVACGSCHVTRGGSDPRTSSANAASRHPGPDALSSTPDDVLGSPGTSLVDAQGNYLESALFRLAPQVTTRRSQSFLNAAYPPELFWDGRARSTFRDPLTNAVLIPVGGALESQVLAPPVSPVEMGHQGRDWNDVAARVATSQPLRLSPAVPAALSSWIAGRSYPQLFQEAFGTSEVTPARIALAIATYERTQWTGQAPIDAFFGQVPGSLTQQEQRGLQVFNGQGRCVTCHGGNQFTNHGFRYIGVRPQAEDLGRFAVTGNVGDRGRMKVPSLRNVELRAPYFHNGQMATLEDVIAFYNRGGDFDAPNKDPNVTPLGLSPQQRADLAAFLRRPLTDPRVAGGLAPFDRPLLSSERAPSPVATLGAGTAGTGGFTPALLSYEPPYTGNPRFTLAVDAGNAGRQAVLVVSESATPPTFFQGATLYVPTGGPILVRRTRFAGEGAGDGTASASFAIPSLARLIGTTFYAQWVGVDPNPLGRLSASQAVAITRY
jgi:cytochrome c peroxidase